MSQVIDNTHEFLSWNGDLLDSIAVGPSQISNTFKYRDAGRSVDIHLGSIHSVKGQTHLSTLVLDTFWHKENLVSLIDWLTQDKFGESGAGVRDVIRLKCHYVAMSRATDLLCLALNKIKINEITKTKLETAGWVLIEV